MRGEATVVTVHFSTEGEAYLCRCTSFPVYDAFCDCIPQTPGKSTRFLTFSKNHRRESKVLLLLLLLLHSVLHFIIFSMPNRSRKPPFSMSVSGKILFQVLGVGVETLPRLLILKLAVTRDALVEQTGLTKARNSQRRSNE